MNQQISAVLSITVPENGMLPVIRKTGQETLKDNDIRVKIQTMGYCGRDKSIVTGQKTAVKGRIGHEGAGVIIEKGAGVEQLKIGQNIVVFPFINHHNIGYDWPEEGKGVFSNFPAIPAEAIHPIEKENITIKDWLSYSLVEPFAGVYRGLERGAVSEKDLVIILGAGPIGCEQTILAKYLNPSIKVALIDVSSIKLQAARERLVPADWHQRIPPSYFSAGCTTGTKTTTGNSASRCIPKNYITRNTTKSTPKL